MTDSHTCTQIISPTIFVKMAGKAAVFWVSVVLSILGINAAGQFAVLHSPESVKFSGSEQIRESLLKEIFSAALGLSTEEYSYWNGLYILNPFETPEAAVEVYVDGVSNLGNFGDKAVVYPLTVDEYEPDTFDFVKDRINQRNTEDSRLVNIRLSDPYELNNYADVFGEITIPKVPKQTLSYLKHSVEEDYQFLSELEVLKAITAAVKSNNLKADNKIDFFNFRFTSLHALSDYHGADSLQTKEAKKLLNEQIKALKDAFVSAYDDSVVFAVVGTDVAHTRRTARAAGDEPVQQDPESYNADYPVIFNIILWFSVVLIFAMVAIVYAIMDMDPGRDSIIYRMTSTRMKKDN